MVKIQIEVFWVVMLFNVVVGYCFVNKLTFLTEHYAMGAYWGSGGIAPLIL
jgi:hypothetical protein